MYPSPLKAYTNARSNSPTSCLNTADPASLSSSGPPNRPPRSSPGVRRGLKRPRYPDSHEAATITPTTSNAQNDGQFQKALIDLIAVLKSNHEGQKQLINALCQDLSSRTASLTKVVQHIDKGDAPPRRKIKKCDEVGVGIVAMQVYIKYITAFDMSNN